MQNKSRKFILIVGIFLILMILFSKFFLLLTPINMHSASFWMTIIEISAIVIIMNLLIRLSGQPIFSYETSERGHRMVHLNISVKHFRLLLIPAGLLIAMIILSIGGSKLFHSGGYSSIIQLQDAAFTEDLPESVGTTSIALMDTASAKMLGDREIGSLSNVVSQYDVSDDYTQIDYQGSPMKIAALDYAGIIKWFNNRGNGVPGYVIVDPVSMSASYHECEEGMVYVPSAYFLEDAARKIWMNYPTALTENLHFEIDEEGNPYYVATVYTYTIWLFGGKTADGCITLDPVTGECRRYALEDVPTWVDCVFTGDLLCEQYNWYGNLSNGYINSVVGKKGCKQVTTYTADSSYADEAPTSDYGFVAKDGDIWIYTGVTSVNGDSSNIGFLLANERTGEAHYYSIAGADEKSAMAAAEGEVQEKGYQASFPSLINVEGNPTYIMVLKDNSGLVKLYAAVNVQQYNLVTTAASQSECLQKYRTLLGLSAKADTPEEEVPAEQTTAVITIKDIKYIDIDGNTYLYLIGIGDEIYHAKAAEHESMLLLCIGDQVELTLYGDEIAECVKK